MKKLATLLSVVMIFSLLFGLQLPVAAEGKVTINFAAQGDSTPATQAVIDAFNASQDKYEAVWIDMTNDSGAMRTQLLNSLKAGSAEYDVISMDVVWAGEFAAAGYLEPLDALMKDNKMSARDYNAGSISAGKYSGKQYALPYFPDLGILYVRSDIISEEDMEKLESGDYTYADLQEMAAKYKGEGETTDGFVYQSKQYEGLVCNFNEFSNNFQDIEEGLKAMKGMMDAEAVPENILVYTEGETANAFIQGDAVFARNWPYQWGSIASDGSIKQDQVKIAPLPNGGTVGGWLLGMNANSEQKEGAFELIKFITGYDGQKIMSIEGGYLPGFNKVLEDEEVIDSNDLLSMPGFVTALDKTISRPVSEDYAGLSDDLQQAIHKFLAGDLEADKAADSIAKILEEKAEPFDRPEEAEENMEEGENPEAEETSKEG